MVERIGFGPTERVLTGMPLGHSYGGEHGVLAPAYGGAAVHVCSGVDLQTISREILDSGITMLPGVPFLFEILAQADAEFASLARLRHTFSAGASLPIGVYEAFVRRFGVPIGQIYGATELGTVTFNDPAQTGFDPMSVGLPLTGVEPRILDRDQPDVLRPLPQGHEGHLAIRAPSMLSHVAGETISPLVDGFVLTGDLAKIDTHGALTITGRLRLLIDVGGRKVNPIEVEQVIREHPQVAECVVVPVQVSQTVSRLKAVIVARAAGAQVDSESIRSFARERLSAYKVPRMVEFRTTLPRTPLGKILRHLVEVNL
jgi:long-chain acyl-CoA synthetase